MPTKKCDIEEDYSIFDLNDSSQLLSETAAQEYGFYCVDSTSSPLQGMIGDQQMAVINI